jgi:hypothetical protein
MKPAKRLHRKLRETRLLVRAMVSASHPILAQIVPIRRCNLDCEVMLRCIDRLAALGTTIITLSGGEPTLHPDLDTIIPRIRARGAVATLITNGLLLERIRTLNRAGLVTCRSASITSSPTTSRKRACACATANSNGWGRNGGTVFNLPFAIGN